MTSRPGVTLIEVLVASVLLAIGIGGTLHAMVAAARLRSDADAREAVASVMLDRLAWFEQRACTSPDSAGIVNLAGAAAAHWRLRADGQRRVLELQGRRRSGTTSGRTQILASLRCE